MSKEINLPVDSRFQDTPLLQLRDSDGNATNDYAWGVWEVIDFPEAGTDLIHIIKDYEAGRIDLLADKYYGNVNLWWVIAYINEIMDPMVDMEAGDKIRIPHRNEVYAKLMGIESNKLEATLE